MTAFEDFVNLELPRRPSLLLSSDPVVAYDGNPNDGGAPAIFTSAPAGTEYLRTVANRLWRKDAIGTWIEVDALLARRKIMFVDYINGSDDNPGTEALPLQTIYQATLLQDPFGINTIYLEDGEHELTDIFDQEGTFLTSERNMLFSKKGTELIGRNSTVVETITITSWTDPGDAPPIANVSETFAVNELQGLRIGFEPIPGFFSYYLVLSNTASTVTFAMVTTAMGGFLDVNATFPAGSWDLTTPACQIVLPAANPTFIVNRLYYDGEVLIQNIDFDFSVNGGFTALTSRSWGSNATIRFCRFLGEWPTGIDDFGSCSVNVCWFDFEGASNVTGIFKGGGFISLAGNVFKDITVACSMRGSSGSSPSGQGLFFPGCFLMFVLEQAQFADFSFVFYTEDGPYGSENFARFDAQGNYDRQNNPLVQVGSHPLTRVFRFEATRGDVNLNDGANTVLAGTPTLARIGEQDFSLAEYLLGGQSIQDERNNVISG